MIEIILDFIEDLKDGFIDFIKFIVPFIFISLISTMIVFVLIVLFWKLIDFISIGGIV